MAIITSHVIITGSWILQPDVRTSTPTSNPLAQLYKQIFSLFSHYFFLPSFILSNTYRAHIFIHQILDFSIL